VHSLTQAYRGHSFNSTQPQTLADIKLIPCGTVRRPTLSNWWLVGGWHRPPAYGLFQIHVCLSAESKHNHNTSKQVWQDSGRTPPHQRKCASPTHLPRAFVTPAHLQTYEATSDRDLALHAPFTQHNVHFSKVECEGTLCLAGAHDTCLQVHVWSCWHVRLHSTSPYPPFRRRIHALGSNHTDMRWFIQMLGEPMCPVQSGGVALRSHHALTHSPTGPKTSVQPFTRSPCMAGPRRIGRAQHVVQKADTAPCSSGLPGQRAA